MTTPWDGIIPQHTLEHYRKSGFGAKTGIGKRPALLVIDVQYSTTGEGPQPLAEAINYHPMNCGEAAWSAIGNITKLLAAFRARNLPVLYPFVAPRKKRDANRRMPMAQGFNPRHWEIVAEVAPNESDILIPKTGPSAFFGTPLAAHLIAAGADTVFVTGNTTSGCIRASVIDAYALNFKVVVPHDGVYDRADISHAVNLFDMASKYAEVMDTDAALKLLNSIPA
ncbi:isochorismatase family protein [Ferrovibrio sp.]|uniref:isochorismatase family protein n=1 Tax=Ferrovibrio sp. TaxID=1917215 RepID=UPI0035B35752